jgi:hypothetical protein
LTPFENYTTPEKIALSNRPLGLKLIVEVRTLVRRRGSSEFATTGGGWTSDFTKAQEFVDPLFLSEIKRNTPTKTSNFITRLENQDQPNTISPCRFSLERSRGSNV